MQRLARVLWEDLIRVRIPAPRQSFLFVYFMNDKDYIKLAIEKAKESVEQGGFPAGAVVVKDGEIIARGISIGNLLHDPTSHCEISAIREACKNTNDKLLDGAIMYSSLEPCMMCLAASMWANVSKIIYACGKSRVATEFYGGNYKTSDLNNYFLNKIEIIQDPEFEDASLEVVSLWEKGLSGK